MVLSISFSSRAQLLVFIADQFCYDGCMLYSDPESARTINRMRILNAIEREPLVSRAILARKLSLNKMTVSQIVSLLLEQGIIEEGVKLSSQAGRRATGLSVRPSYASMLLVDAGLYSMRIGLVDAAGTTTLFEEYPTVVSGPEEFCWEVSGRLQSLTARMKMKDLLGVAVSFGGLIDRQRGVIKHSPNWGWHDVPLAALLEAQLDLPVVIDNNVRTMLLAESWFSDTKAAATIFYVNWAQGIGSAVMHDGVLLQIDSEFGHIPVADTRLCSCGKIGCLEAHASGRSLGREARALADDKSLSICQLLEENEEVRQLFRNASVSLGKAIAITANLLSPDLVVIAGGLAGCGSYFLDIIRAECIKGTIPTIASKLEIRTSAFAQAAGIQGTAALALDHFIYDRSLLSTLKSTVS